MSDQETLDSEGRAPNMPAGTRVMFLPDRDSAKHGTIEVQMLHYDCGESFFGNVRIRMDDGRYIEANCWQCKALESQAKPKTEQP
jgi:hypothetical protein